MELSHASILSSKISIGASGDESRPYHHGDRKRGRYVRKQAPLLQCTAVLWKSSPPLAGSWSVEGQGGQLFAAAPGNSAVLDHPLCDYFGDTSECHGVLIHRPALGNLSMPDNIYFYKG